MKDFKGFRFDKRLARGGMASVYKGTQLSLERPVAIKELYPHLAEDNQYITRFELEAKVLATFSTENIVGILDYGEMDGSYFIVMEFVDGFSLKYFLQKYGKLDTNVALTIAEMMAKGLAYAHGKGVIHRDIKPDNILMSTDGAIKIADFGLTRSSKGSNLTVTGTVMGTPAYMSPEQAKGNKVDERTDIFAWGITFYEMLTGVKAFSGDNYTAVLSKLLTESPKPLADFSTDIPKVIVRLIDNSISKDISVRPNDFNEILSEINLVRRQFSDLDYPAKMKPAIAKLKGNSDNTTEHIKAKEPKPEPKNLKKMLPIAIPLLVVLAFIGYYLFPKTVEEATFFLQLSSNPLGAQISINGITLDSLTPAIFPVDSGSGELEISLNGYETQKIDFIAEKSGTTFVELALIEIETFADTADTIIEEPKSETQITLPTKKKPTKVVGFGSITVLPSVTPYYVFIDGQKIGSAGLVTNHELSVGKHIFELSKNKAGTLIVSHKEIYITKDDVLKEKPLAQETGNLFFPGERKGLLSINGRIFPKHPPDIQFPVGTHTIKVKYDSGTPMIKQVTIRAGMTETIQQFFS